MTADDQPLIYPRGDPANAVDDGPEPVELCMIFHPTLPITCTELATHTGVHCDGIIIW